MYAIDAMIQMSMNFSDIDVLNNKGADYCYFISGISKSEALILTENTDFTEKSRLLLNIKIHYHIKKCKDFKVSCY